MMLVARLGVRSIEIARLELGDVDWRSAELVVHGKGRRHDCLPLPAEVVKPWSPTCPAAAIPSAPAICS